MRRETVYALGLLMVAFLVFTVNLGGYDLWPPDEPRYGLVAREMMDSGDYFLPRVNNEPYKEKPPLLFWMIVAASTPAGEVTAWSTRLPSALAGVLTLLVTFLLARRLFDARVALWAMAILLTTQRFWWNARFGQIDMLLTACLAAGLYAFLRHEETGRSRYLVLFYAMACAGVFAKGPGVLVFPVLFVLARGWSKADLRGQFRHVTLGCAIVAVVYGLWAVPAHILAAREVEAAAVDTLTSNMFRQTVGRFLLGVSHANWPWYYFKTLPVDWLPWTLFLPWMLLWGWRRRSEKSARFLLCWTAPVFIFFSIAVGKRAIYLLPLFPAIAIALAGSLGEFIEGDHALWRKRICSLIGVGYGLVGVAPLILPFTPYGAYWTPGLAVLGVTGLLCGGVLLHHGCRGGARRVHLYTAVAFVALATAVAQVALPVVNAHKSAREFCAPVHCLAEQGVDFDLYSIGFAREEYVFYSGRFFKEVFTDVIPLEHEHDMGTLEMLRFQRDLARAIGKAVAGVTISDIQSITDEELAALQSSVDKVVVKGAYSQELVEDFKHGLEREGDDFFSVFDDPKPAFLYVQENDWRWIYAVHPDVHGAVVVRERRVGSRHVLLVANIAGAALLSGAPDCASDLDIWTGNLVSRNQFCEFGRMNGALRTRHRTARVEMAS